MQDKRKEREEKKDAYSNRKGGQETSLTKLIIVQITQEPLSVGYVIPPQLILSIRHGEWSKHERGRIHQNLWRVFTHQPTRNLNKNFA